MNYISHSSTEFLNVEIIIEFINEFGILGIIIILLALIIMSAVHFLKKSDIQIKIIYPRDKTKKKELIEDPAEWISDLMLAIERANMIESDKGP